MLNAFYEETFPNLRYITFVNGRTRAEIVPELEVNIPPLSPPSIHLTHSLAHYSQGILSLSLPPPSQDAGEMRFTELRKQVRIKPVGSGPWREELKRDLKAMWDIARSRLEKLGVE